VSTVPVQSPSQALLLVIMSGSDKGVAYRLVSQKISIGRDPDNDIVLNDTKCSRHHCQITISNNQIIARDVGSKSGIFINGQRFEETTIQLNQPFQVGETTLCLRWTGAEQQSSALQTRGTSVPGNRAGPQPMAVMGGAVSRGPPAQKNSKAAFYGVIAVVGILVIFALTAAPKKNSQGYGLRTEAQIEEDIQSAQKRKDDIFREKMAQGVFNSQAGEAQAAYIQGFRDFREGHYNRAIQAFTATLALNPDHALGQKYKRLAEKKLDELVQYYMLEGKRAYDQNKFELAKSAYINVLIELNDPNNKIYQEAKERRQEVELLLKGRY
jgi:hypothetical protein